LQRGRERAGLSLEGFEVSGPLFVVTGNTEEEMAAAAKATRQQIAFYGSTPAYRAVLDLHGWGELQDELNKLSKRGEWEAMGELIDDEVLNTFAVVAEPEGIASELRQRFGDIVDRLGFYAPYKSDPERWAAVWSDLRAA
ncbi:MAG: LLM class flavin-dependent oxidoreductase, partial [Ilumatobacteraceae bacterium]